MADEAAEMLEKLKQMHDGWDLTMVAPPNGPQSGAARQKGGSGLVRYRFSQDKRGRYLEFYSFHRIWGDTHARIYESGEVEHLPTLATFILNTGDPAQDAKQRELRDLENRRLIEELENAGLLSGGPVPGSFVINAALVTGVLPQEEPPAD